MENSFSSLWLPEGSLHVDEVKQTMSHVVAPVTLQQKFISILKPSDIKPGEDNRALEITATVSVSPSTTSIITSSLLTQTTAASIVNLVSSCDRVNAKAVVMPFLQTDSSAVTIETPQSRTTGVDRKHQQVIDNFTSGLTIHRRDQDVKETVSILTKSTSGSYHRQDTQGDSYPANNESEVATSRLSREVSTIERGNEMDREPGTSGAQVTNTTPKRDVMLFFHEQEKSLHERFFSMPQKTQQIPRPVLVHKQAAGLEHLDNLIHLMEQLTSLKDENSKLRKRCNYLESTRTLLEAKKVLACDDTRTFLGFMTPPFSRKHPHHHRHQPRTENMLVTDVSRDCGLTKTKMSNPKSHEYVSFADTSSDQETDIGQLSFHNHSYSAGSLEERCDERKVDRRKKVKGQTGRRHSKHTAKGSKWIRVKKVLTGHKFYKNQETKKRPIRDGGHVSKVAYSTSDNINSHTDLRSPSSIISGSSHDDWGENTSEVKNTSNRDQVEDDPDLTTEVWMGPPDWWEEFEASKGSRGTSANSEPRSPIEITTIYLSSKHDYTASTAKAESTSTKSHEKYLSIDDSLFPGLLSPSLVETGEEIIIPNELNNSVENTGTLHKGSSCKSADLDIPTKNDLSLDKKPLRSAWGRVKDIIHTRKDSIKRKLKRDKLGLDSEEGHKLDIEASLDDRRSFDAENGGLIRQHRTSPLKVSQQKTNEPLLKNTLSKSPISRTATSTSGISPGNVDMATLLAGNISQEFSKKMQDWEKMKYKKTSARDESDLGSLDLPKMPQQFPICTIHLRDLKGRVPDSPADGATTEESNTSMEVLGAPSISVDDSQRQTTDSHSRKMQEWDSLKYKESCGPVKRSSPTRERKDSSRKRGDRHRSKSKKEKERGALDQQKEEKDKVKLEKDHIRGEKNRVRALECEEKLEKLSDRVNQAGSEIDIQHANHGPQTGEAGDVMHKQDEVSNKLAEVNNRETVDKASRPPPLTNQSQWDSADDTSATETYSEASHGDKEMCATDNQKCQTKSNIATLERANTQLLENLHKKEIEYAAVQEEVHKVNEKLTKVREDHAAEMEQFHSDLAKGKFAGPVKLEVGELEATVGQLEETIKMMENFGEKLASSMESAAVGKWQSIEAEETVHKQLLELIEQMRAMLVRASQTEEHSQKTMALSTFETFYAQAMKLQVQMNNLRLSHMERNREILVIKRQLLLQEVNNLLLQADITRKETELYQFQEAKTFASIKRWNTFGGSGRQRPKVQVESPPTALQAAYLKARPQKEARPRSGETPRISIPYTPEKIIPASPTISYISTPASSLGIDASGESLAVRATTDLDRVQSPHGAAQGQCMEHTGTHCEPFLDRRDKHINLLLGTCLDEQQVEECVRPLWDDRETSTSQKSINHVQPSKYSPEQPAMTFSVMPQEVAESSRYSQPMSPRESMKDSLENTYKLSSVTGDAYASSSGVKLDSKRMVPKPQFTTFCDSVPLHKEIAELRRVKRKVEKGASAFKKIENEKSLSGTDNGLRGRKEVFDHARQQTAKQQNSDKSGLEENNPAVNGYFPTSYEVECSETTHTVQRTDIPIGSDLREMETLSIKPPLPGKPIQPLPSSTDQTNGLFTSSLNPDCKSQLSQETEETDAILKDYRGTSPMASPSSTRGKPPLPRQFSPAKLSPSASPVTKKGPRSKSVGDMNREDPASITSKPLQEIVSRFEKRATVCETGSRPFDARKTPSPTLHLPRVGLVSRMRRIKPATELIEESQRYRSGHSIYTTRILQRYFPKDNRQTDTSDNLENKERQSDDHVQKLSQETNPARRAGSSRTNSDLSLKRSDSLRRQKEFTNNVSKTESHINADPALTILKRVQIPSQTFNQPESDYPETDPWTHDSDISASCAIRSQHSKSCETPALFPSEAPMSKIPHQTVSSPSLILENAGSQNSDSTGSIIYKSLPTFGSAPESELILDHKDVLGIGKQKQSRQFNNIHHQSASTPSSPRSRQHTEEEIRKSKCKSEKLSKEKCDPFRLLYCPSPNRKRKKGASNAESVKTACEQSVSFDLGLSNEHRTEVITSGSKHTEHYIQTISSPIGQDATAASYSTMTEDIRPVSLSSDGKDIPSYPTTADKEASNKCLEPNWLQKSKRFFKFSK